MKRIGNIPHDVSLGITVGLVVGLLALWFAPTNTTSFYAAAVQVVPVFLVALVLERSLVEMLGTESTAVAEEIARVGSDWTPPSRVTRTFVNIERLVGAAGNRRVSRREYERLARMLEGLSDSDVWRSLATEEEPSGEQLEQVVDSVAYSFLKQAERQPGTKDAIVPSRTSSLSGIVSLMVSSSDPKLVLPRRTAHQRLRQGKPRAGIWNKQRSLSRGFRHSHFQLPSRARLSALSRSRSGVTGPGVECSFRVISTLARTACRSPLPDESAATAP